MGDVTRALSRVGALYMLHRLVRCWVGVRWPTLQQVVRMPACPAGRTWADERARALRHARRTAVMGERPVRLGSASRWTRRALTRRLVF